MVLRAQLNSQCRVEIKHGYIETRLESERHPKSSPTRGTMKLSTLILLLLAAAASGEVEKRVVGGKPCKTDRQYHVQIQSIQPGKSCGGSLINTGWVITASHCAEQAVKLTLGLNNNVGWMDKIGSWLKRKSKKLEQDIKTEQQFSYKDEEGKAHDIMLIKLNENMSPNLPTIRLPPAADCTKPEIGQQVEIGGWGAKKADILKNKLPKSLQCASTDLSTCGENDKPGDKYVSDEESTMCAFKWGVETCFGDAGSAVEYNNILHGIVLSNPVDMCASTIVMANICHYRAWIDKTMRENALNQKV
ncbi:kallikrein-14-like [Limanda limanda]|uniref:kallikrein-14-like n=1 Tax=Limanda limanda TaxID=27771 RepID=UPI0029C874A3|nr:kallikrein-14-like [Limanda limanda]